VGEQDTERGEAPHTLERGYEATRGCTAGTMGGG